MGFIEGLMQTGQFYNLQDQAGELADIVNYLELPLNLPSDDTDSEKRPRVIRVALKVTDPKAIPLDVQGIESITLADYPGNPRLKPKLAYLYKKPVGSNVTWGFSPIYKLGRGIADPEKAQIALLGEEGSWREDKNSRFYKMNYRTLADYEDKNFFTEGSSERIMHGLEEKLALIVELWDQRKASYLIVFGVNQDGRFIYPGENPAFTAYFRSKLVEGQAKSAPETALDCVLCRKEDSANRTLDDVFKFSTFDKPGFLPGGTHRNKFSVYPICEDCFGTLQRGYTESQNHFTTQIGLSQLQILIVPELVGSISNLDRLQRAFDDYIAAGVQSEWAFFANIAKRDANYIFHFLFTEKNQAQVRILRMVEDVPPSHFRKLFDLWNLNRQRFYPDLEPTKSLDSAIRQIVMMLQSLAGKTDGEKQVIKNVTINLIGDLFSNTFIEVESIKRISVSRLPGLVSDSNWLNAKPYSGAFQLERLWMLFEFLYTYNQHLGQEEVNI